MRGLAPSSRSRDARTDVMPSASRRARGPRPRGGIVERGSLSPDSVPGGSVAARVTVPGTSAERSMLRRRLLVPILLLALGAPAVAQPKKVARVGYLAAVTATADAPRLEAFRQGLRELGYVEGQNIVIECRGTPRATDRLPGFAAELVLLNVDVLVAVGTASAQAARHATNTSRSSWVPSAIPSGADS